MKHELRWRMIKMLVNLEELFLCINPDVNDNTEDAVYVLEKDLKGDCMVSITAGDTFLVKEREGNNGLIYDGDDEAERTFVKLPGTFLNALLIAGEEEP